MQVQPLVCEPKRATSIMQSTEEMSLSVSSAFNHRRRHPHCQSNRPFIARSELQRRTSLTRFQLCSHDFETRVYFNWFFLYSTVPHTVTMAAKWLLFVFKMWPSCPTPPKLHFCMNWCWKHHTIAESSTGCTVCVFFCSLCVGLTILSSHWLTTKTNNTALRHKQSPTSGKKYRIELLPLFLSLFRSPFIRLAE